MGRKSGRKSKGIDFFFSSVGCPTLYTKYSRTLLDWRGMFEEEMDETENKKEVENVGSWKVEERK